MSTELSNKVDRPSYLINVPLENIDNSDLNLYAKPPRIKVVQGLTKPPIKPPFAEGDIVVIPQLTKIGDRNTPFTFVPIHFFPSWICMNPIKMMGTLKAIREFSADPNSELAKKCKSFAKEKCPENKDLLLTFAETLNFMVVLEGDPEWEDVPIHLFFSRGEYPTGQKLIALMQQRKAPRYACRFQAITGTHQSKGNEWPGLDLRNDPQPWVAENKFRQYELMYNELKKLVDNKTLELDLEDFTEASVDTANPTTPSEF